MYSMFYVDSGDQSKRVKHFVGKLGEMSERAGLREHARIMEDVNRRRGTESPAYKGQTFAQITELWRTAIAPNLSPATVRQRESYLRSHVIPRFGDASPHSLDVAAIQEFATHLRKTHSRKTVINVLSAVFSILDYAGRCGSRVSKVRFADIQLGSSQTTDQRGTFLTRDQASRIIAASPEPYQTMFALAWATGLRAGELLALNVADLDFERRTIYVSKSSDDATREIRQPKTRNSTELFRCRPR
jgi:integrase